MEKKSKWMYFIPVLYLIVSYGLFFLPSGNSFDFKLMVIGIPCVMGIINLVIVLTIGRKWPRKVLLNCALLIKYALIPFYLISGCLTGYFIATIFILLLLIGNRMLPGGDLYEREEAFFDMVSARTEYYVEEWIQTLRCPILRVDGTKTIKDNVALIVEQLQR